MTDADKERKIPAVLIAVGVVLYVVAGFLRQGAGGIVSVLVFVGVASAVGVGLMVVAAFITAKITGTSFGELDSAVLKLSAIYLFPSAVAGLIPVPLLNSLVAAAIAFSLLIWLFDLEVPYAIVFTVITWVVNLVAAVVLGAVLGGLGAGR